MKYLAFLILLSTTMLLNGQTFNINTKGATVDFNYVSEKTKGALGEVAATLKIDRKKLGSATVSGSVDVSTLTTGNKMRDKHLKSKDFFDAATYPTMTFVSSAVYQEGEDFFAKGKLTIKDITKEVVFKINNKEDKLLFKTTIYAADVGVAIKKDREKSMVDIVVTIPM